MMRYANGRAAEITPSLRDREGAYADLRLVSISVVIFNFDGAIGVGDTSPSKMLDKSTLSTGACHDRGQYLAPMFDGAVQRARGRLGYA